ncbi:MAG: flippase [Oscillospiraceae bacterium]|nr:flippase [Oscillospiraceae bacterium]
MKSLKKNIMYNTIYQFLILFLPFITSPYLARIIGPNGVGVYSYSHSVAQYFVYAAMLGLQNYGNRSIASVCNNRIEKSKVFCEIYCMQITTALLSTIVYIVYSFFSKDVTAALIMIMYVASTLFDINWLFFGTENFKITVTRNTVIKLLCMACIFLFVKDRSDTYVYITIMAASNLLSQIVLWPFVKREVDLSLPKWADVKKHYKPNLMLFIPVIAISIYKIMDKIMLGQMTTMAEVGYYEYAERIYNIPLLLITAIGTVMLPRMTFYYSNAQINEAQKYLLKSMDMVLAFANAAMFGMMSIANDFISVYYGSDFADSAKILQYLSTTIVFLAAGNVLRTQFIIPKKKDNIYIKSAVYGAVVNFIINILLIPSFRTSGAAIGTISAEAVVFLYQVMAVRKEIPLKKFVGSEILYFLAGVVMCFLISFIRIDNTIISLILKVLIGGIIYVCEFAIIFYIQNKQNPIKWVINLKNNR